MPALGASLRFLLRSLADFAFPPICCGCDSEAESGLVCDSCRLLLFTSELDVCPRCGRPCADAAEGCGRCEPALALHRVRALGLFAPPMRGLVHALKYDGKTSLAPLLGSALAALVEQDTELRRAEVVAAVPLHPARRRERGYNQSELLARVVAERTGRPWLDPLARHRNTSTQTRQPDARARWENVSGAFGLRPGASVAGLSLLLVDDVMTSGATLDAAASELVAAGAVSVAGLVVAAAGRPDRAD